MVTIYRELFQKVVEEMNKALTQNVAPTSNALGILDMYGFENLETNRLEQRLACAGHFEFAGLYVCRLWQTGMYRKFMMLGREIGISPYEILCSMRTFDICWL